MSLCRKIALAASTLLISATLAHAEGYVLGAGIDADTADGRAYSVFGDFGVGDDTWLSLAWSENETTGLLGERNTTFANVAIDHWFNPVGIRMGASYWGNSDILDSTDLNVSLYFRGDTFMFSADYERRDFDFVVFANLPDLRRKAEFTADGLGLTTRFSLGENASLHFGGVAYDYSREIRLQQDIDVLRFLSSSRLSMINSLIDHRINAGVEYRFGLRSLDLSMGSWQTAVDGGKVDSVSVGFLTPMSDRTDIEFRVSVDDSKNYGTTTAFSVYLYYFGGN